MMQTTELFYLYTPSFILIIFTSIAIIFLQ
jgi:hypothetical protein